MNKQNKRNCFYRKAPRNKFNKNDKDNRKGKPLYSSRIWYLFLFLFFSSGNRVTPINDPLRP